MKKITTPQHIRFLTAGALFAALVAVTPAGAASGQAVFSSPEQAAKSLIEANRADSDEKLLGVLGADAKDLLSSGDPVADKAGRKKFIDAFTARHKWESDGKARKILVVGRDAWPLPIPLVKADGKWQFDAAAGREEILDRRIGHNELRVIDICRAFVVAQKEYAAEQPAGDAAQTLRKFAGETDQDYALQLRKAAGTREYAQKFLSSPGKHDGLFWQVNPGEKESPFGPLVAQAEDEGYMTQAGAPVKRHSAYHGYYYRILKAQGPAAAGGARDYVSRGRMTGGFALLASPAKYGDSGLKTFVVNQAGIVYEKDLGPDTATAAAKIKKFDPDKSWSVAVPPVASAKKI